MPLNLENLLQRASDLRATTLLILPGQKPTCRVGRELQPPLSDDTISPEDSSFVAADFLTDQMHADLITGKDNVERPFLVGSVSGRVTIFLGLGVPHLVFHLEPAS